MSKNRRFLFVTFDAGGNVPPTLALVRRLVRRGHEVRVLGNSALAARITDRGGIFRAFARARDWGPSAPWATDGAGGLRHRRSERGTACDHGRLGLPLFLAAGWRDD
jgi:hypothetical protein